MKCPKCKNQISENLLKCNHCGARIASLCKKCGAYNSIYNLNCTNCKEELLKICPSCKGVNFPNAEKCRKCSFVFINKEDSQVINPKIEEKQEETTPSINDEVEAQPSIIAYNPDFYSQQSAKDSLLKAIEGEDKKIISLSGSKGIGKSVVLRSVIHELREQPVSWLYGECNVITQLSPCGLIQDLLLTFFNIKSFCSDSLKIKKESQKFFQNEFPSLTNEEIFNLLNFIYPTNKDFYENILLNKEKTFIFLEKVFKTIISNNSKTIFVIENFDMIDGMSYEFFNRIIESKLYLEKFKIILTYNETRPARGYFYSPSLSDAAYLDISLNAFDSTQIGAFLTQYFPPEKNCPQELLKQIHDYSGGIPAVLEQLTWLVMDYESKNNSYDLYIPKSFKEIVKERIELLSLENKLASRILLASAVSGAKFYPSIINQIFEISEAEFITILNYLQQKNFIIQLNEFSFGFKNSLLWEALLETAKQKEDYLDLNEKIYSIYSGYTLSSISLMAIIAQNLNQKKTALTIWTENLKLASYIGDTNLYLISQKQSLSLIEELDETSATLVKNNINERLGKLLSKFNPSESKEYLTEAVYTAKKAENVLKEIELAGYLANCCMNTGDYYGTVECVDSIIDKIDYSYELELAMLKSRKIDALLNIGNSGQIVNLVDNEIMPVFEKYLGAKPHKNISVQSLYSSWLKTYLVLANALALQGDNRVFEVLSNLFEIFKKNEFDNQLFICKSKLALSLANTIKGDIEASEDILEEIITLYKTDVMDNEAISKWNLINILNNFIRKKYHGLKEELFQVVTFANNVNDNFTKNILKTFLGKIFKDEENAKQAIEIYEEQITYFAKEKNAIGALLGWYLISEAYLVMEGPDKTLEVAQKALDVAQSPKINNYFFVVLYNKIIAEAYIVKSDYEMAKIHIEKAIMVARKFELLDLLAQCYHLYGKYLQDIALVKSDLQNDYAMGAFKMYKKAALISQTLKNSYIAGKVEKSKAVLNSFCQLNGIILK